MFKNYFSLVASELFSRLISLVWIVYMARILGVADYGRYSTIMALISIATSFIDLGVSFIIVREMVRTPSLTRKLIAAQIYLRLVFGVSALFIIGLSTQWPELTRDIKIFLLLASVHMLFHNIGMIGDTVFTAYNKQYLTAIMHTCHNLGWALFGFLLLSSFGGLKILLIAMVVNSTIICVVYLYLVFSLFGMPDFSLEFNFCLKLVKAAIPIGITGVFAMVFQRVDRLLLSHFCGPYEVGLYSAASTLIGPITEITWCSAVIVLYPYMNVLYEQPEKFKIVFRNVLTWIFAGILAGVSILIAYPDKVIGLAFGYKYASSTYVVGVLALQLIPLPFHGLMGRLLMVQHRQISYGIANFSALITNLLLNFIFIPQWGILGASVASVITNCALIAYYAVFGHVSLWDEVDLGRLSKIVAVAIISAFAPLILQLHNVFACLVIFSIIYFSALYWLLNIPSEVKRTVEVLHTL